MNEQLLTLGQILSSAPRLAVLEALLDGEMSVSELSAATGRSGVSVRRHLERLESLGVVERVLPEVGRTLMYRALLENLQGPADAVQALCRGDAREPA